MSAHNIELCYEYFDCKEFDCIRRKEPERNCWDINDVQCQSHSEQFEQIKKHFKNKLEACKLCIYYQNSH